jgi:hypothetical protein
MLIRTLHRSFEEGGFTGTILILGLEENQAEDTMSFVRDFLEQ